MSDHARAHDDSPVLLAAARDALRAWEAEQRIELGYAYAPLPLLPAEVRSERAAVSGLRASGPIGELLADAIGDDGIVSRALYTDWLGGCGPAYLVESLLPRIDVPPREDNPDADIPAALRREIVERDGDRCQLAHLGGCVGKRVPDHCVPVVWGGTTSADNLWLLCHKGHNMQKLGQWPRQYLLNAWLASSDRPLLPACYSDLLKRRTWREIDWDREHQTWQDELRSIRRRQLRERRALRSA